MTPTISTGRVAGKVALITGAGSGIGRATALRFAAEGAAVLCTDLDAAAAMATANAVAELGGKAHASTLDVTSEVSWEAAIQRIDPIGGPDVVVNCAGIAHAQPIVDLTLEEWRRVMSVNLEGVLLGTKHGIRAMRRHGRGGSIVNVSSVSGLKAAATAAAYCASKAAVCMLSRVAALECKQAGDGVRVNTVVPTGVKTPMWRTMPFFQDLIRETGSEEAAFAKMTAGGTPADRFAEPEEVAAAILYLASDEARFITATELLVDNGGVA